MRLGKKKKPEESQIWGSADDSHKTDHMGLTGSITNCNVEMCGNSSLKAGGINSG